MSLPDRDLALVTLLLGTGVRVSECVGLDIEDVDFKNNGIKVTRKGGNEMVVYFGHEVEKALKKYLEVRKNIVPVAGHEHALFYSTQRKRIGIQAVENLVKKYAGAITTTKKSHHIFCGIQKLCTSSSLVSISSIYAIFWVMLILRRRKHMHVLTPR